jgi:hypothetical protein
MQGILYNYILNGVKNDLHKMMKGGVVSKKKVYETGASRSSDVEGVRYDLVPAEGVEAVAQAMHEGAESHGDHNWKKGLKNSVLVNHALRHIYIYMKEGHQAEDHIGHACANLMMLKWNEKHLPEFNDLGASWHVEAGSDKLKPNIKDIEKNG